MTTLETVEISYVARINFNILFFIKLSIIQRLYTNCANIHIDNNEVYLIFYFLDQFGQREQTPLESTKLSSSTIINNLILFP